MPGIINFEVFLLTALIVVITPGIDTIMVLTRSISKGRKVGLYSAFGVSLGLLVHTVAATFGLSVVIAKSALAFHIIKYIGAVYLIYIGIMGLTKRSAKMEIMSGKIEDYNYSKIFFSAFLSDLLNPKIAIFFLAFLPQFISTAATNRPEPYLFLGLIIFSITLIWCTFLALSGGQVSVLLNRNRCAQVWLDKLSGVVFILLGVKVIFTKR